ncbi:MAG: 4-(cytidine 5'-diphospho)-2-C-methyl-D-erythritol kinase [Erysipelotrichaceae bacterium]|nr:4-(cytidine 5'-diphospho)-2-C-methyl-D-erythritol kinase [Erysipelotrichaceae bacterium]
MIRRAYGKINLSIDVLGRNEDGYHDLDMIELPIDLYDEIEMTVSQQPSYSCNIDLPYDEKNLIHKTVEGMRRKYGFSENFDIRVSKNIPMNAGLAGGSCDAAAVIHLISDLLNLNLSEQEKCDFGCTIGADVPFCLVNRPARVRGIGEMIETFELPESYDILLIKPQDGVCTREAFETLDIARAQHPDIGKVQQALQNRQPLGGLLGNSLLESAQRLLPVIGEIIEECRSHGFESVMMSGSGSTCFVLQEDGQDISRLYESMKDRYDFVRKTAILTA